MPTIRLPLRYPIALMLAVALAGCAGTPDLSELRAQVEPPPGLVVSNDAELDVRLVGAGGTLAETHVTPRGPGPWPVVLRYAPPRDDASVQLRAELRQQGRVTHSAEPLQLDDAAPGDTLSLPILPRP
ncbi:hypothetical protein [Halomonas sp. E14]|uniref:hypothetical protein n=1 Tax=Halomonas sp. E14 TaxID=3397245 RepID=UPI00403EB315